MRYIVLQRHFTPYPPDIASRADIADLGRVAIDWQESEHAMNAEKNLCEEHEEIILFILSGMRTATRHNPLPVPMLPQWKGLLVEERSNQIVDSRLTPVGHDQTKSLAAKIRSALSQGMPLPSIVFTSVAWRTCETAVALFGEVMGGARKIQAIHNIRDRLNGYPMTALVPLSEKKVAFPQISFDGISEEYELLRTIGPTETHEAHDKRAVGAFHDIWDRSGVAEYIAVVAHADPLQTFWLEIFDPDDPMLEKAEMRIVVIKRTV